MPQNAPHPGTEPADESFARAPALAADTWIEAEEVIDGLPVLAEVRTLDRVSPALPAVQAAAAAATGFMAGAATLALVRRRSARRTARVSARRAASGLPIVGTRSFLVDVHLIAKPRA